MKERLIELIYKSAEEFKDVDCTPKEAVVILADYLIANGVIVPPCKVGDKVYCIYNNKVIQGTVRLIRPFISKKGIVFKGNIICEVDNFFLNNGTKEEVELYIVFDKSYEINNGIDRIAYLTKEEAEQKLKERDIK